jgi:hemolysin activation/secretion protein
VSVSRGSIGLLVALLSAFPACLPAVGQQDRPLLRLLIFGAGTQSVAPARSAGVDDREVPILETPAARALTTGFIGRSIDDELLDNIREQIRDYYTSIGHPFVDIAIPAQDVGSGVLHVDIIEMKRGRIQVQGNRWFDDRQYIGAIRTRAGDPIDTRSLEADAGWINRGERRHATISVGPGEDPSTYDLIINAKDRFPLELTLAADNTGTTETGLYRTGINIDWSNAFWRGDDLNYSFLTDPGGFKLLEHAVTYTGYLPWRDSVTLSAVTADTRGQASSENGSSVNGHEDIVSFRYSIALPSRPDFIQHIDLGYDFKSTNTNILSGGTTVFPSTSELNQFSVAYAARRGDSHGLTGVTAMLVGSPGHLTPRDTQAAFVDQQPGATPSYLYSRISLGRLTNLPFGTAWSARLTGQYSSDNLLPSEQLAFGGVQSIRGFVEFGATRDTGILMQNEWRLAPVNTGLLHGSAATEAVVPFVFLDLGAGRNHLNQQGVPRSWVEMVSAGPGLTWQFGPAVALRLSWGVPLVRNGHTGPFLGPQFGTQITF